MKMQEQGQQGQQEQMPTLEESFSEIEAIIGQLEGGEITLDESFRLYQKGVEQLKHCNQLLDTVEKKLQILNENGDLQDM